MVPKMGVHIRRLVREQARTGGWFKMMQTLAVGFASGFCIIQHGRIVYRVADVARHLPGKCLVGKCLVWITDTGLWADYLLPDCKQETGLITEPVSV